ncbi:hypothetical protein E2C01_093309 [Portunus trituberculatus]|uniref:Uncharacterized protein n=1 Tax=Portunus trituberculatus TaxID=210409 RepID=A0A5B7JPG2_PORTR|nr:hypothetical protein [Portunus trituberculatus]
MAVSRTLPTHRVTCAGQNTPLDVKPYKTTILSCGMNGAGDLRPLDTRKSLLGIRSALMASFWVSFALASSLRKVLDPTITPLGGPEGVEVRCVVKG